MPSLVLVLGLLIIPMLQNLYHSFFSWNGISTPQFIGLENYLRFFSDSNFITSVFNTLIWVLFTIVVPVGGGLFLAVFLKDLPGEKILKSIFYLPLTISFVSTGSLWTFMFSPELGLINSLIRFFGGEGAIHWLTTVPLNTFSLLIAWSWQQIGFSLVMFLMGLTAIPKEPVEAARIDGAGNVRIFMHITIPMLRPITTVVVTMAIINSLKSFDIIYVVTRGGPYRSSETLAVTMFRETFVLFNMGYGSAIAVLLSIVVILLSYTYIRRMTGKDSLYY